ncbi:hypothetical protein CYMTET_29473 [Cymbomonas tetramitiformis]|uniref:Uncharacterized protein n=1 Tax=Cymbomonas tetramitiformis TaxID=36881 RepID=A0AAE0FKZ3_9CHLO|nr:hypothetical protein CYMTET_29473 [Cymbomonas tetramitiformis]
MGDRRPLDGGRRITLGSIGELEIASGVHVGKWSPIGGGWLTSGGVADLAIASGVRDGWDGPKGGRKNTRYLSFRGHTAAGAGLGGTVGGTFHGSCYTTRYNGCFFWLRRGCHTHFHEAAEAKKRPKMQWSTVHTRGRGRQRMKGSEPNA